MGTTHDPRTERITTKAVDETRRQVDDAGDVVEASLSVTHHRERAGVGSHVWLQSKTFKADDPERADFYHTTVHFNHHGDASMIEATEVERTYDEGDDEHYVTAKVGDDLALFVSYEVVRAMAAEIGWTPPADDEAGS